MMICKEEHKERLVELLKGSAGMTRSTIASQMHWSVGFVSTTVNACIADGTLHASATKYGRKGHEGTVTYVQPRASFFEGWGGAPELGLTLWRQQGA